MTDRVLFGIHYRYDDSGCIEPGAVHSDTLEAVSDVLLNLNLVPATEVEVGSLSYHVPEEASPQAADRLHTYVWGLLAHVVGHHGYGAGTPTGTVLVTTPTSVRVAGTLVMPEVTDPLPGSDQWFIRTTDEYLAGFELRPGLDLPPDVVKDVLQRQRDHMWAALTAVSQPYPPNVYEMAFEPPA